MDEWMNGWMHSRILYFFFSSSHCCSTFKNINKNLLECFLYYIIYKMINSLSYSSIGEMKEWWKKIHKQTKRVNILLQKVKNKTKEFSIE